MFRSLYSAHSADVLSYALRRGVEYPDAEEVVVDTFLVLWRRLGDVPEPALPWLLGAARRVLANQQRSRRRREALHWRIVRHLLDRSRLAAEGVSSGADFPPDADRLSEALATLSDADREVVTLVVWQGLTHEAAAGVLGCTRNALTKRLLRICRDLKAQICADRTYT